MCIFAVEQISAAENTAAERPKSTRVAVNFDDVYCALIIGQGSSVQYFLSLTQSMLVSFDAELANLGT